MFADTGIPVLFKAAYKLGVKKQRMKVIVAGGALDQQIFFNIDKRNDMAVRKMFHRNNVVIDYRDVGGNVNRTVKLAVKYGEVTMKVSGREEKKICMI